MFSQTTEDGKIKHSFTGLRKEFPNYLIHKIINEGILPLRKELMKRPESGGETQITDSLRTYMMTGLDYISRLFQTHAFTKVYDPDATLATRQQDRDSYINSVLDKSSTPESRSRQSDFTHSDNLLPAADAAVHSVSFDYVGLTDKDMAQPTPERVQNSVIREVIYGLDLLVVQMTVSHSADNPRTILAQEAARWLTDLDEIYYVVDSYDPGTTPFHPTALSLNEKDNMFNADGSYDVVVGAGGAPGELDENDRVTSPAGVVVTGGNTQTTA